MQACGKSWTTCNGSRHKSACALGAGVGSDCDARSNRRPTSGAAPTDFPQIGTRSLRSDLRQIPLHSSRWIGRCLPESSGSRRAASSAAARALRAATPPRRRAWLRIFVVRCGLPCDPPVGGHSCNGGMIPRFHRAVWG